MTQVVDANTTLSHYRIVSKIGAGGMGEVYLAQDTKLERKVALKILPKELAANHDRMRRFVQEAKAVSALNHPNIITIYEIADTESGHFIATEFIDGATLREHALTSSLTVPESLDVAIQIANALAAAHAVGIVHRDIKPDNVMLRRDGIVKVLDFGLAKLLEPKESGPEEATRPMVMTRSGVVMGTVTHMSPEQARGQAVDARSDIWSFGVVLYELVAKHLPFEGPSNSDIIVSILEREPAALTSISPEIPDELQRIITKILRKDRDERYQSVNDLLVDLKALRRSLEHSAPAGFRPQALDSGKPTATILSENPIPGAPSSSGSAALRKKIGIAVTAAILVGIAAAAYFFIFKSCAKLTEKDTILLADFVNTTGDATFDGSTLKQALAVQLRQTPFVNLLPEESMHETLRYMNRGDDERITKQIGSEICKRRGLKAMLVGSIASIGSNYAITLEAINGQTGETIASHQVEAEKKEQVLKSLGEAALQLRQQLGESLASLQKYNAPIEQATTSSLEALNLYSKGLEQIYRGDYKSALPLFNKAVELDPNFAESYVWLSWTYANFGDSARTAQFADKAYSLRSHVTELEKLHIDEIYHLWSTGDFDKQKEADELIARLYPNDWLAHNSLSIVYKRIGKYEQAATEARAGLRVNPNESHLYWHLGSVLLNLNRFDEARDVIMQGQALNLDHPNYRLTLYSVALVQGNTEQTQQQLDEIRKIDGEQVALTTQIRNEVLLGRWEEAQHLYQRVVTLSGQPPFSKSKAFPVPATLNHALFGFCDPTSENVRDTLSVSRITSGAGVTFIPITADGSLCGEAAAAQKLANELLKRFPDSLPLKAYTVPIIRAAIDLQHEHAQEAIEDLNPSSAYDGGVAAFWPDYLRAEAYLRLRRGTEAAAEFQKIIDNRGWDPFSPMYPLAYLGLARADVVRGDTAAARKHYDQFFAFWKDADQDLPVLIEAKKEYQKLG